VDTGRQEVQLQVAEGIIQDVGKGIVRIDSVEMDKLGVNLGDVVEITGGNKAVAKVMPALAEFTRLNLIQMDGNIRENCQVGIGELVSVRKIDAYPAKTLVLAPSVIGGEFSEEETAHIKQLMIGFALQVDNVVRLTLYGIRDVAFKVRGVAPKGTVVIKKDTTIRFASADLGDVQENRIKYEDIGGLEREVQRVREIIDLPLRYPQMFKRLGIEAPKGVLLYGPPGTGKTLIARAVANESAVHFIHVDGPEIMHKYYGESEGKLREIFERARKNAPSIIFLDEIDAIAPKRSNVHGDVEKRVVAQLLALMDGLESRGQVIVIAATNIPELVDPALRRPGRFDREIAINPPDQNGRLHILRIHARGMSLAEDVSLEQLAQNTHGFVGADLEAFCREAGMHALRRLLDKMKLTKGQGEELALYITAQDFQRARLEIDPAATREFFVDMPNVAWESVGGLEEVKNQLITMVEWPLKYQELFQQIKLDPPKGILLTGPAGTGKTLMAKAIAGKTQANFITVTGHSIFSRWIGESEKALHQVFRKAKQAAPCILFFDEIDALVPARSRDSETSEVAQRLASQFLVEMDGLEELKGVIVLAATNRPDMIEPVLLRPGRFDFIVEFPKPDVKQRLQIFQIHAKEKPLAKSVDLAILAEQTAGLVGSDIEGICKKAAMLALGEWLNQAGELVGLRDAGKLQIQPGHFQRAIQDVAVADSNKNWGVITRQKNV
jgi:transitional endoplasmic reticulum ATPase